MTYHKTWFSYVLWVIYTMLCIIFLFSVGNYVCVSYLSGCLALSDHEAAIPGLLTIPLTAVLYWLIRRISGTIRKKHVGRTMNWTIPESIVVLVIFALGIFFKVTYVLNYMQMDPSQGSIKGLEYYDMAAVTSDGSVQQSAYGGASLYVLCLSFVLSFLGNKVVSAIVFQVIVQIAGMALLYTVTRKTAGRIPACTVLLYFACSSGCLEMLGNLGPECLFFVLYMLVMLTAASYVRAYCANRLKKAQALAGAAVTGILIGALGYLDLTAVTILPVMAAVATGRKKRQEDMPVNNQPGISGAAIVMAVLFCVVGFLGTTGIVSWCRGTGLVTELDTWISLHLWNTRTFGFKPLYPYSLDMLWFGVLAVFAAFLVFEFFRSGREQNYMPWILLCIVAAPTPMAVFGVQPFGIISMYIWGVLAGLGLQNCMFGGKMKLLQTVIEEINHAAEEAEGVGEADTAEEVGEVTEEVTETSTVEEEKVEKITEGSIEEEVKEITEDSTGKIEKPSQKPRFIENPLPLPKKHVRKQMDYQYDIAEQDMKFDLDVRENDDFDI